MSHRIHVFKAYKIEGTEHFLLTLSEVLLVEIKFEGIKILEPLFNTILAYYYLIWVNPKLLVWRVI